MLSLFEKRDEVSVVEDQVMSPTWAGWLADTIIDLIRLDASGVYHASSGQAVSWYEFASEILELTRSNYSNGADKKILPIPSAEFPTKAKRPVYSVLGTDKLQTLLERKPISWREGLEQHLIELGKISESELVQGRS